MSIVERELTVNHDATTAAQEVLQGEAAEREVVYAYSPNFPHILRRLQVCLLVSTYQAGKVVVLGASNDSLAVSFHNFDRAMGLAVRPDRMAVGTTSQVWLLRRTADLVPGMKSAGKYDACYLTRSAWHTGPIHAHEMAWCGDELWVVNTLFSCLCPLDDDHSFIPRWLPPFVSALAVEDRCQL